VLRRDGSFMMFPLIFGWSVFGYAQPMTCERCRNTGWVCERHPHKPWDGLRACGCGAARMPCPRCAPDDGWDKPPVITELNAEALWAAPRKPEPPTSSGNKAGAGDGIRLVRGRNTSAEVG
jgi:hypothetical protein